MSRSVIIAEKGEVCMCVCGGWGGRGVFPFKTDTCNGHCAGGDF